MPCGNFSARIGVINNFTDELMTLNESDTRAKLIDPALHSRGWTEDLIQREETAGAIVIEGGKAVKKSKGRVDYVLRVKVSSESQPVAVALIEAKAENLPPIMVWNRRNYTQKVNGLMSLMFSLPTVIFS